MNRINLAVKKEYEREEFGAYVFQRVISSKNLEELIKNGQYINYRMQVIVGLEEANPEKGKNSGVFVEMAEELNSVLNAILKGLNGLHPDNMRILIEPGTGGFRALNYPLPEDESSSAVVAGDTKPERLGGIDFRQMNMLIQPMGSFSGLDFSPAMISSSSLEAVDLDKELEGLKQMTSNSIVPSPTRDKEYVSACILKGRLKDKADDFVLMMQEVFQLQAEEGIESSPQEREALVMADTRSYCLPEKQLAFSANPSLN